MNRALALQARYGLANVNPKATGPGASPLACSFSIALGRFACFLSGAKTRCPDTHLATQPAKLSSFIGVDLDGQIYSFLHEVKTSISLCVLMATTMQRLCK